MLVLTALNPGGQCLDLDGLHVLGTRHGVQVPPGAEMTYRGD